MEDLVPDAVLIDQVTRQCYRDYLREMEEIQFRKEPDKRTLIFEKATRNLLIRRQAKCGTSSYRVWGPT